MRLNDYFVEIEDSTEDYWSVIDRPIFRQDLIWGRQGETEKIFGIDEHHTLLSLKTNLNISISLGLNHRDDFAEDWAQKFADSRASSHWVDFQWCGQPIYRDLRVSVDGGRCGLPVPEAGTLDIPERQSHIYQLIDGLIGIGRFYDYFKRAGFNQTKGHWPE